MSTLDLLERAFQLAESGRAQSVKEIRVLLAREGYSALDLLALSGPTLTRQLSARIKASRLAAQQ